MLFTSLLEAAQNSPFKTPFSTVSCQTNTRSDGPQLTPNHQIMAAAPLRVIHVSSAPTPISHSVALVVSFLAV
ncbi:unnamed protein product [Ceratitis capitata]|uniref:(Mediterranean fruit fly) hypothetical protein n=1 Tax=Ceratitis capitata TaxID=7213 RepID=A0A811VBP6_CERCA|nr:unnamed protein product [Ceratitis capitata]